LAQFGTFLGGPPVPLAPQLREWKDDLRQKCIYLRGQVQGLLLHFGQPPKSLTQHGSIGPANDFPLMSIAHRDRSQESTRVCKRSSWYYWCPTGACNSMRASHKSPGLSSAIPLEFGSVYDRCCKDQNCPTRVCKCLRVLQRAPRVHTIFLSGFTSAYECCTRY